jgi:hypothetical protein
MCERDSVGREHVPPSCLFPETKDLPPDIDLRKNLMTVQSCSDHNSQKSGEDQYFLNVLTSCDCSNDVGKEHYRRKIRRQNVRNSSILRRFADRAFELNGRLAHNVEIERLDCFIEQLAHALYFAHFGTRWLGDLGWIPEFLSRATDADPTAEHSRLSAVAENNLKFEGVPYYGSNRQVFAYQVLGTNAECQMRLHFYEGCKVWLEFSSL